MPTPAIASATAAGPPDRPARPRPSPKATTTTRRAMASETRPAGIGLPGLWPASRGASTTSLVAPIPAWRATIASPRPVATIGVPPAATANAPAAMPSRIDGNGWTRRATPASREASEAGASDVDELAKVGHEIFDQSRPAIGNLRSNAGDEGEERDRRDHEAAAPIPPDDGRRPTA